MSLFVGEKQSENTTFCIFGLNHIAVYLKLWFIQNPSILIFQKMKLIYLLYSSLVLQPVWVAAVQGRRRGDMWKQNSASGSHRQPNRLVTLPLSHRSLYILILTFLGSRYLRQPSGKSCLCLSKPRSALKPCAWWSLGRSSLSPSTTLDIYISTSVRHSNFQKWTVPGVIQSQI